ncbi:hypothetical protein AAY473_037718 [Plecturocebus cupreus]
MLAVKLVGRPQRHRKRRVSRGLGDGAGLILEAPGKARLGTCWSENTHLLGTQVWALLQTRAAALLSFQKDVALDLATDGSFRNKVEDMMTEDTSSDDVSEEAAKNVILNAQILKLDPYPVSMTALGRFSEGEANSRAPRGPGPQTVLGWN